MLVHVVVLSVLFLLSFYFFLKSFFHLFLIPAMVPDENSMEDPLCNSAIGSMVSLDYVTPDKNSPGETRCRKSLDRLGKYDTLEDHRWCKPSFAHTLPSSACSMGYFNVMGAVCTSTRADACALQAYTQLPAPSNNTLNSGMMSNSCTNFRRLLCASSRTLMSFGSMVPGISGLSSIEKHTA